MTTKRPNDLPTAVLHALENYYDLDALQASQLAELEICWPVAASPSHELMEGPSRGVAVRRLLDSALDQLKETQSDWARLLHLRFWQKNSTREVGEAIGLSRAAVYKRLDKVLPAFTAVVADMATAAAEKNRAARHHQLTAIPAEFRGLLVGLDTYLDRVCHALRAGLSGRMILVVTGLGGIGKSSLVGRALEEWVTRENPPIARVLWATVEQHSDIVGGLRPHADSQLLDVLVQLSEQLDLALTALSTAQQRLDALSTHLLRSSQRVVVVVDNVETKEEIELALSVAWPLLSWAQVIVTSRHEIADTHVRQVQLEELEERHALELLQREAMRYEMQPLPVEAYRQVYHQVGGHPLALKLMAGQLRLMPLSQVLGALQRHSALADKLYTHVYESSWQLLDEPLQWMLIDLLLLPTTGGTWKDLKFTRPDWDDAALERAVEQLSAMNLLRVAPRPEGDKRYSLHRLTYRFLEHKTGMAEREEK